ncbi:MAG: 50S ribosomal protein L11 methyltransferase [Bacteroidota bacterium]
MSHIEFTFQTKNNEEAELIIALLSEINFDGFQENEMELKAYIKEPDFNKSLFDEVAKTNQLTYTQSYIKEENWNAKWESEFEPITVFHAETKQPFAFVRANFHEKNNAVNYDLLITPKMSFGTGHHATTLQMMEQMSVIDFNNKKVIDFGTGTGLLAILAEKLGAQIIEAIDYDDWSINNTIENVEANDCKKIKIVKADSCISSIGEVDILLANINLNVIVDNIDKIRKASKPGAIVLFSGILINDKESISQTLMSSKFSIIKMEHQSNWLIIKTILQ